MSEQGIRDMIVRFPSVLGYSVDANLRPTLECLRESANLPAERLAKGEALDKFSNSNFYEKVKKYGLLVTHADTR